MAAERRLFFFPHAGGAPSGFRAWAEALAPQVQVFIVALPGREGRFHETPLTRFEEIVVPVATAVASLDARPFALFGHSMGSMLAFEVARQLRRSARRLPAALIVSGRCAPQLKSRVPILHDLPDSELVRQVARLFGVVPVEVFCQPELIDLMARVLRADLSVIEKYRYIAEAPLDCPILALCGGDDPWVTDDELQAWGQHTSARFESARFEGDHFYFKSAAQELLLLARLREFGPARSFV